MANIQIGIVVNDTGAIKGLNDVAKATAQVGQAAQKTVAPLTQATKGVTAVGTAAKKTNTQLKDTKGTIGGFVSSVASITPQTNAAAGAFGGFSNGLKTFTAMAKSIPPQVLVPLTAGIAGLFAAIGGSIVVLKLAEIMDQMKDTADSIGITVEQYQAMNAMLVANGSSMDKFSGAFASFQDKVGSADKVFKQYGITLVDNQGNLRDTIDIQDEFLTKVSKMQSEAAKISALRDMYGKKGASLMGSVISPDAYLNAKRLSDSLVIPATTIASYTAIGDTLDKIKGQMLKSTANIFKPLADDFKTFVESIAQNDVLKNVVKGWMLLFSLAGTYVIRVGTAINYVMQQSWLNIKILISNSMNALNSAITSINNIKKYTGDIDLNTERAALKKQSALQKEIMSLKESLAWKQKNDQYIDDTDAQAIENIKNRIWWLELELKVIKATKGIIGSVSVKGTKSKPIDLIDVVNIEESKKELADLESKINNFDWTLPSMPSSSLSDEKGGGGKPKTTQVDNAAAQSKLKAYVEALNAYKTYTNGYNDLTASQQENLRIVSEANQVVKELELANVSDIEGKKVLVYKEAYDRIVKNEDSGVAKRKQSMQTFSDYVFSNRKNTNDLVYQLDENNFQRQKDLDAAELESKNAFAGSEIAIKEETARRKAEIDLIYAEKELAIRKKSAEDVNQLKAQEYNTYAGYASSVLGSIKTVSDASITEKNKESDAWATTEKEKVDAYSISARRKSQLQKEIENKALEEKKKNHEKQKRWSIAQGIINGAVGITNAWANGGTWASNLIESGLVALATGAEIAAISMQSFANGGVVGGFQGASSGNDNTTVNARNGEMFLNAPQQKTLFNAISSGSVGGNRSVVITQGNITITGGASQSAIEQIKAENQKFSMLVRDTVNDLKYRRQISFA